MNIAILNLSKNNEIDYTISCLNKIHDEVIGAKIDIFIHKEQIELFKDNKLVNQIIPLDMDSLNIFNYKVKMDGFKYYIRNKYNIAIDTQGTFKSAFLTYQLTGKTAGFKYNSLLGNIISIFYDEKTTLKSNIEKKEKTLELFSKTFGFEINV